jgi:hypothetical protein
MKMVKSLLLGSAAGLVAIAGAQAADLPVKAKPVEYVKVCSLYGVGFYYIPGTDTCLKVGGFVRHEWGFHGGGSHSQYLNGNNSLNNRQNTHDVQSRTRANITLDARTQTEIGTVRTYVRFGPQWTTGDSDSGVQYFDAAFIQFAGFTVGKIRSFYDFAEAIAGTYTTLIGIGGSTGNGVNTIAYTAQFGSGFSATIGVEDPTTRRAGIWNNDEFLGGIGGVAIGGFGFADSYAGASVPDIIANIRVDQAWGSAQLSGVLHQVRAGYYDNLTTGGHPGDAWGWAIQGGVQFNLPWAKGDRLLLQAVYGKGASEFTGVNNQASQANGGAVGYFGGDVSFGWAPDAVFVNGGGLELIESWGLMALVEHYWTPALRTSLFGTYSEVNWNGAASAAFCTGAGSPITWNPGSVCNPDYQIWQVGTKTVWNPVANLDIGVELLYTNINTDSSGTVNLPAHGANPTGTYTIGDNGIWSGMLRFQRNFWP